MNMHFKDKEGRHRIVAGDIGFVQDQKGLRGMLEGLDLKPSSGPIIGVIRGGKFKVPERFALPSK